MIYGKRLLGLFLRAMNSIWLKLGWRTIAVSSAVLVILITCGLVVFGHKNNPPVKKFAEKATQAAERAGDASRTSPAADTSPQVQNETVTAQHSAASSTSDPKHSSQAPSGASLTFSVGEISVHAGWESSTYMASISNGQEFSGLSKEWNDDSPVSVAMPLGTKQSKTVNFFISAPVTTTPGAYALKVRTSGASDAYAAILKVRVLPPLVAFDTITYDDYLEGYIITLKLHENFSGDPVLRLSASPNGTPCAGNNFFIDQVDEETFTFECAYGLSGATGSFPLTFEVSGAGKVFTKSITWTL